MWNQIQYIVERRRENEIWLELSGEECPAKMRQDVETELETLRQIETNLIYLQSLKGVRPVKTLTEGDWHLPWIVRIWNQIFSPKKW